MFVFHCAMSTTQDTDTPAADSATPASTPKISSEQKGIAAVSDALKSVFGDLQPEGSAAPAAAPKGESTPAGEDDGLSAGDIDELLKGLEGDGAKPDDKKPDDKKPDAPADPFAKIEENWDADVAQVMRDQAAKIADLEARIAGNKPDNKQPAGPVGLAKHLTDMLGADNKLVQPGTVESFTRLVDKTAIPVAQALAAARPPKTPEDFAAIEREAISIVVARITNKQPAAPKQPAPPKTSPPGGNAGAPAAHRSALSHAEKGVSAIAKAMAALG